MSHYSVTGERLHEDTVEDVIPGATPFFQVDLEDIKSGKYVPPEGLPSNPQEYLRSVAHEARNIPDVVVAKIDPQKMKPKVKIANYVKSTHDSEQKSSLYKYSPQKEWQERQLTNFAIAREQYTRHLAKLKSISRQTKKRPKLPIYPLPPWNEEESWKCLCFGKSLNRKVNTKKEDKEESNHSGIESDDEVSDTDDQLCDALAAGGSTTTDIIADQMANNDDRVVDLETLETGFPPMMRILLRMDSNQVEANLEYHSQWIDEYGFSHDQGRWIYALLSCLEKPLFPTIISLLRDLCRKCIEKRSQLDDHDGELVNGLNLIICIIGRYFDQTDLADTW